MAFVAVRTKLLDVYLSVGELCATERGNSLAS
jgi:hypothetical protein